MAGETAWLVFSYIWRISIR